MKHILSLAILAAALAAATAPTKAQTAEIGFFVGTGNYIGDLAPDIVPKRTLPAGGAVFRVNFSKYLALTANATLGRVHAFDSDSKSGQRMRNLDFTSNITEFSGQLEFNFFKFGSDMGDRRFSPFLLTGIGAFSYDPYTYIHGHKVYLREHGTEGQGLNDQYPRVYSRWAWSVPLGGGIKWNVGRNWRMALQSGFRWTTTDYLDDVSGVYPDLDLLHATRGFQARQLSDRSGEVSGEFYKARSGDTRGYFGGNDWYVFSGLSVTYIIRDRICPDFGRFRIPLFS